MKRAIEVRWKGDYLTLRASRWVRSRIIASVHENRTNGKWYGFIQALWSDTERCTKLVITREEAMVLVESYVGVEVRP